jgi:hypothetical protein
MRFLHFIAAAWLALTCALAPAQAEKRVALVIGNDRYANLPGQQLRKAERLRTSHSRGQFGLR